MHHHHYGILIAPLWGVCVPRPQKQGSQLLGMSRPRPPNQPCDLSPEPGTMSHEPCDLNPEP